MEELGISVLESALEGPLAPTHRRDLRVGTFHDAELVQSYSLRGYEGRVTPDPVEVAAVKFEKLSAVEEGIRSRPDDFTQWIRAEGSLLHWFRKREL
ncbi:hypothetical protein H632_c599p2 [Helicosporidium sp. ATCC 50920]|nr:hypothetical protein H632_c599p2 [Helicosporidium sp. ATCC 50920]|eukprot:KDD75599.1 hypothetical protein H632_c599p2 [Helicosporidium sp. ATCC 50920]